LLIGFTGSGTHTGKPVRMLCLCVTDCIVLIEPVHIRRHSAPADDASHVNTARCTSC